MNNETLRDINIVCGCANFIVVATSNDHLGATVNLAIGILNFVCAYWMQRVNSAK